MAFTSKRGRPKSKELTLVKGREEKDLGTQELQRKRASDLTAEPVDLCKKKGLVSDDQYSAALHFRWLYTIRFGAPGISAVNLDTYYGRSNNINNEEWQKGRERDYAMAVEKLRAAGALKIVMNIAVFNYLPRFLRKTQVYSPAQMKQNMQELTKFLDGLDILIRLFRPKSSRESGISRNLTKI